MRREALQAKGDLGMEFYTEQTVSNWQILKTKLSGLGSSFIFRGQAERKWDLASTLTRSAEGIKASIAETAAIEIFKSRARQYLNEANTPGSTLEWLALMQHHGAPTRLLDWSKSPYVAAYFALEAPGQPADFATIWAVNHEWLKLEFMDTAKKCITELSNLHSGDSIAADEFFNPAVLSNRVRGLLPIQPHQFNQRQGVQQGLFLCVGDVNSSLEDNVAVLDKCELRKHIFKLSIRKSMRKDALEDLFKMNVSSESLFPGIDGFSRSLPHRLLLLADKCNSLKRIEQGQIHGWHIP